MKKEKIIAVLVLLPRHQERLNIFEIPFLMSKELHVKKYSKEHYEIIS